MDNWNAGDEPHHFVTGEISIVLGEHWFRSQAARLLIANQISRVRFTAEPLFVPKV